MECHLYAVETLIPILIIGGGMSRDILPLTKFFPKALLEVNKDLTILDYQMSMFKKNNFSNIYMIIGYRGKDVKKHCEKKNYNMQFFVDKTFNVFYSQTRAMYEVKKEISTILTPFISIFSDVLFNQKTLNSLLGCNADICYIRGHKSMIKWSKKGIETYFKLLEGNNKLLYNDGIDLAFAEMRTNKNLTTKNLMGDWMVDIDNIDDYNTIKTKNLRKLLSY